MHPKQQSVNPVANPQNLSTAPAARPEWQAEADAHYRRLFPNAGNPPRTLKPTTLADLRDRVQVAQIRELAHAAGQGIRSRHHYARRED
jgi:hypothetical protein